MGWFVILAPVRRLLLLSGSLGVGLAPGTASAEVLKLGSDLVAPAEVAEAHPVDTVYWHAAFAGGRAPALPSDGQVAAVRVRGFAQSDTPPGVPGGGETDIRIQTLLPEAGTFRVRLTSAGFRLPNRLGSSSQTVTRFRPENLCGKAGDVVGLNTIGGFGLRFPEGTPLQVFAAVPGSATSRFTGGGGTNNGALLTPRKGQRDERVDRANTELLMQIELRTGTDASFPCRGSGGSTGGGSGGSGGSGGGGAVKDAAPTTTGPPARIPSGAALAVTRRGVASVSVFCSKVRDCAGKLTLTAASKRIGRGSYAIGRAKTKSVRVRLTSAGLRLVKRRRYRLAVRATTVTKPGGKANTAVRTVKVKRRRG